MNVNSYGQLVNISLIVEMNVYLQHTVRAGKLMSSFYFVDTVIVSVNCKCSDCDHYTPRKKKDELLQLAHDVLVERLVTSAVQVDEIEKWIFVFCEKIIGD